MERADALETLHVDPAALTRNLFHGGPRSLLRQC
jgi:hypothetical protein